MKNPQYSFIRVKDYWIAIKFIHMTRNHLLFNFDKCRKAENEDSLQMWIGSYNTRLVALPRFSKGYNILTLTTQKEGMGYQQWGENLIVSLALDT